MTTKTTTPKEEEEEEEEEEEVLTTFTDDEAFVLCLLFMVQISYRQGELGKVNQHVLAFLAQWDEMGKDARNEMSQKIGHLAREIGYPQRAQDLVENRAREQLKQDISDENLPDPGEGVFWN